nr:hypothetical protein [Mesorhizobium sp.]
MAHNYQTPEIFHSMAIVGDSRRWQSKRT